MTLPIHSPGFEQGPDSVNGLSARPHADDTVPAAPPAPADRALHQTVIVRNPLGLHLRAAMFFAERAAAYPCSVAVWKAEQRANGKSLWDLIGLAALQGTELVLEVEGDDASTALASLAEALAAPGNIFDSDDPVALQGFPPKG